MPGANLIKKNQFEKKTKVVLNYMAVNYFNYETVV